jgi:MraZ protein
MPEFDDKLGSDVDFSRWSFGFNGQYRHSLDEKGRLSVPANFRRDAAGNAIGRFKLTVGFERCGRVMVPAPLREYAGVGGEAIVNGMYNRVEIWSVDRWLAYEAEAGAAFEDMAARYKIKF